VPASLCKNNCDACKHPNLVAKYLEELSTTSAFHRKNGSSRIYISGSSNVIDEEQFSEFWNHDDEASGSDEDISDSDDAIDVAKSLTQSSLPSNSRLNEKMELLQRAEENYYGNKIPDKQTNKLDKNAISETLRVTSKQRLSNALKQTEQRLSNLQYPIDLETSASFLESECYKKYGKTGKSFYCSQVASTVRWLSATTSTELLNRLGSGSHSTPKNVTFNENSNVTLNENSSPTPSTLLNQVPVETSEEEIQRSVAAASSSCALQCNSKDISLPPIPSFSEFISDRKGKNNQLLIAEKDSPNIVNKNPEKRMRLQ
ncbi:DNA helicase, partial [Sarracenia purpurea var. burkii]